MIDIASARMAAVLELATACELDGPELDACANEGDVHRYVLRRLGAARESEMWRQAYVGLVARVRAALESP